MDSKLKVTLFLGTCTLLSGHRYRQEENDDKALDKAIKDAHAIWERIDNAGTRPRF